MFIQWTRLSLELCRAGRSEFPHVFHHRLLSLALTLSYILCLQNLVKSFEITDLPVRTAKFVPRKQWIVCGADDLMVRVFNYNTMDKVKQFEAHSDYIRSIAVHPTLPLVLTCSDDMLIKLWDWEKGWACTQVFEGHSHYVMQVVFNPKDTNTFASASLDRTVKVWSLGSPVPNFTLEGHERGVNAIDYYHGGDRPYLLSGADDRTIKVWDYQTKACIQTLEGHGHNIAAVAFHPELPIIITGSEDGAVKLWHSTTYRLESTLNYGMERVWSVACVKGSNALAIGYDDGCVMVKVGREEPVVSMDTSGKVIWARHSEIQSVNIRSLGDSVEETDGERLPLATKDLGASEMYPQSLVHSPNGRFVAVCGDGEYVIYTALAWRNKSFGSALEFAWGEDSNTYAVRESAGIIKVFKNFKEALTIKLPFAAEGIHGGALLGVRGTDFIAFYDWNSGCVVRRIDANVKDVFWSESGQSVAVATDQSFYILEYCRDAVESFLNAGEEPDEDGIEDSFDLACEIPEKVRTGIWVGDCFIYTNAAWRLCYCIGGETSTLHHLDKPLYLLGYLASQSKVYLIDRDFSIVPFTLLLSIVEYKTLISRGDLETAASVLETIPHAQHNAIAKFLEAKGMVEEALQVATDIDYKFELAVQLGKLELALTLAEGSENEGKWRQLGELALARGRIEIAEAAFTKARDLGGLLLLKSSTGDPQGLRELAATAEEQGKQNIAFVCRFMLGDVDACIDTLVSCGRTPEAAFFARTYRPSRISETVKLWQKDLAKINPKAAESLADPVEYPNLFPGLDEALEAEAALFGGGAGLAAGIAHMGIMDDKPAANGSAAHYSPPSPVQPVMVDEETVEEREEHKPSTAPEPEIERTAVIEPLEPEAEAEAEEEEEEEEEEVVEEEEESPDDVLTPEEEALLEEEFDDEDIDLDGEDDWGLDEEEEEEGVDL